MQDRLSKEQIADGLALARLKGDEDVWPALERLIKRLNEDLVAKFLENDTLEKSYVKGGRDVLLAVLDNIDRTIQDTRDQIETEKAQEMALRAESLGGMGQGDLALS